MRFGYCICYHRPRKVIRQRGFPCRGPLPSLSSDILIFFWSIKREMCCEFSHLPLLFIIYLFMSVKVPCNAPGAEIHVHIHPEPDGSDGGGAGSRVGTARSATGLRGFRLRGGGFPAEGETPTPSRHAAGEDGRGERTRLPHSRSGPQPRPHRRVHLLTADN